MDNASAAENYKWEETYARVVRSGSHILFFERLLGAYNVKSLVIVSPWIGPLGRDSFGYSLEDIAAFIVNHHIVTYVVTRAPETTPTNHEAVRILLACPSVNLFYNDSIHAKFYVCRCEPFGFALLSSANLSSGAASMVEIGLMIDGKGYGQAVVEELEALGKEDLPNMAGTRVAKYAEKFEDRL